MIETTGELIAIKESLHNPSLLKSEYELLASLSHINIIQVTIYQQVASLSTSYLLMEYISGRSLYNILHRYGPLHEMLIKKYIKQLLTALKYLHHQQHIIHRDIKSKNILIHKNGVIKLCDFGSAIKVSSSSTLSLDTNDINFNTEVYTAPELIIDGIYDYKVDIWSLGCVIIEMYTTKLPWSQYKFKEKGQCIYHIATNVNEIPKIPKTIHSLAQDFIKQCLYRDPKLRWNSIQLLKHPFLQF